MADEEKEAKAPKKPKLFENKIFMVGMMVVLQGGMAFLATQFLIKPATQTEQTAEGEGEGEQPAQARQRGVLVSLDEMVVSLNSGSRARYLRTTIAIEAVNAKVQARVEERMPEFRDAAIMALSHHGPEDLLSFEGKEQAKAEIKEALKGLMDEGELLNVYYSDFVVQ